MIAARNEKGATAIVVAISLLMLLGFTSLAIDGGLGFDDRRGTQNAADAAALAAAWEHCNNSGPVTPTEAARDKAAENGYVHTPSGFPQVTVSGSGDTWTVTIDELNQAAFGRATPFAPDEVDVKSTATARCFDEGVLGGFALFAKAEDCATWELDATSSNVTVSGAVHSNGDLHISGSSPSIDGELTYRDRENVSNPGVPAQYFGSAQPYPIDVQISEYELTGQRAIDAGADYHDFSGSTIDADTISADPTVATHSSNTVTILKAGIYYTDAGVDLKNKTLLLSGDAAARGVTFVAEGQIEIKEAGNLTGFDPIFSDDGPKMLFFSNFDPPPSCQGSTATAIKVAGSNVTWGGVLFAPNAAVDMSTATNVSVNGSVIAYTLNLSGGLISVTYQDDPNAEPSFRVELLS